jgi:hypothetical protein
VRATSGCSLRSIGLAAHTSSSPPSQEATVKHRSAITIQVARAPHPPYPFYSDKSELQGFDAQTASISTACGSNHQHSTQENLQNTYLPHANELNVHENCIHCLSARCKSPSTLSYIDCPICTVRFDPYKRTSA